MNFEILFVNFKFNGSFEIIKYKDQNLIYISQYFK